MTVGKFRERLYAPYTPDPLWTSRGRFAGRHQVRHVRWVTHNGGIFVVLSDGAWWHLDIFGSMMTRVNMAPGGDLPLLAGSARDEVVIISCEQGEQRPVRRIELISLLAGGVSLPLTSVADAAKDPDIAWTDSPVASAGRLHPDLPAELQDQIFRELPTWDARRVGLTCKALHQRVSLLRDRLSCSIGDQGTLVIDRANDPSLMGQSLTEVLMTGNGADYIEEMNIELLPQAKHGARGRNLVRRRCREMIELLCRPCRAPYLRILRLVTFSGLTNIGLRVRHLPRLHTLSIYLQVIPGRRLSKFRPWSGIVPPLVESDTCPELKALNISGVAFDLGRELVGNSVSQLRQLTIHVPFARVNSAFLRDVAPTLTSLCLNHCAGWIQSIHWPKLEVLEFHGNPHAWPFHRWTFESLTHVSLWAPFGECLDTPGGLRHAIRSTVEVLAIRWLVGDDGLSDFVGDLQALVQSSRSLQMVACCGFSLGPVAPKVQTFDSSFGDWGQILAAVDPMGRFRETRVRNGSAVQRSAYYHRERPLWLDRLEPEVDYGEDGLIAAEVAGAQLTQTVQAISQWQHCSPCDLSVEYDLSGDESSDDHVTERDWWYVANCVGKMRNSLLLYAQDPLKAKRPELDALATEFETYMDGVTQENVPIEILKTIDLLAIRLAGLFGRDDFERIVRHVLGGVEED